jgi:hypothetical protein
MGKKDLIYQDFARFVSGLCARTPLARDRPLYWSIIANPRAGGFTIRSRWKKHRALLEEFSLKAEKEPPLPLARPVSGGEPASTGQDTGLILTERKGHAASLTQSLIGRALGLVKSNPAAKPSSLSLPPEGTAQAWKSSPPFTRPRKKHCPSSRYCASPWVRGTTAPTPGNWTRPWASSPKTPKYDSSGP